MLNQDALADPTTEKGRRYQEYKRRTLAAADKLGRPMDVGIVETVVLLNLFGVITYSSCEGHLDRPTGGPWIMFENPKAKPLKEAWRQIDNPLDPEYKRLRNETMVLNLQQHLRIVPLLDAFYADRQVPYIQRLILDPMAVLIGRLQCQGAEMIAATNGAAHDQLVQICQSEMSAFTNFLAQRYFTSDTKAVATSISLRHRQSDS